MVQYRKFKYGFFNNFKLSHPEFISWIGKRENIRKLIKFVKKSRVYAKQLVKKNYNKLLKNNKEVYFPRLIYAFFLKERITISLQKLKEKKESNFFLVSLMKLN